MSPKKTSLYPVHEKLGASFTDFGGWDMPVRMRVRSWITLWCRICPS